MSNGVFFIKKFAYLPNFNKILIEMTRCFFVFERSRQKTFRFRSRSRLRLNKIINVLKPSKFVLTIDTHFLKSLFLSRHVNTETKAETETGTVSILILICLDY
jgi:hypothetical protein